METEPSCHMVFDWYNHDNGKSWKTSKQDARDMQTIAAEVLSMGKEVKRVQKNLDGLSYKIAQKMEETESANYMYQNLQMGANILREQIGRQQENSMKSIDRKKKQREEEMQHSSRRKN